ncbi:phenylacetate--CoA ligase family protein [Pseudonocardia spinosispora]|uniref:phenylacetate--CoA ligase family protein n=1 Tax=Pseudonocardia spinosispora TaxID=103441 RepID=UPI00040D8293|nr:phenylacetate--CoA ligase family protein [Pseudonocardia spinosispora]
MASDDSVGRAARHAALRAALPEHLQRRTWNRARLLEHQRGALRELLSHAATHSPFHAARIRDSGLDPARVELADLARMPTMTKTEMMAAFDGVVTDRRLTRAVAEAHLGATGTEATELMGRYMVLASGGSSGERGMFVYERDAAVHYRLGALRDALARTLATGPLPPGGLRRTMVAAGSAVHATRATVSLYGGALDTTSCIPATLPIAEITRRLNAAPPTNLHGYPSVLAQLAEEKSAGRLLIEPIEVRAHSEPLSREVRARVSEAFGVPVGSRYGTSEGLYGTTAPGDPVFVLTGDLAIVELVDSDNRPVPDGTESSKILITNLYNRTQPLIRYELTDRMIRLPDAAEHGHPRVTVRGRDDELMRFDTVAVHPHAIRSALLAEPGVVEYQVTQEPQGIHVDVIGTPGVELAGRLTAALVAAGLREPKVTLAVVGSLQRDPRTGKASRFRVRVP